MKRLLLGGFAALAFAAACAGGPRSRLSPGLRDQYQLQADELVSLGPSASLYEVVERLRHRWLEARSSNLVPEATDQIGVYVGSRRLGGVNELRYIAARNVASARFIAAREASALYGPGHANGVILVEMK